MMTPQKKASLYWKINFWRLSSLIILIIIALLNCNCNNRSKSGFIIGFYNIDKDYSVWERTNTDVYIFGDCISFTEDSVFLPIVARVSDTIYRSKYNMSEDQYWNDQENQENIKRGIDLRMKDFFDARGTYKITGRSKDSIIISAPRHPLNGKYVIHYNDLLYNILNDATKFRRVDFENDSTFLQCYIVAP